MVKAVDSCHDAQDHSTSRLKYGRAAEQERGILSLSDTKALDFSFAESKTFAVPEKHTLVIQFGHLLKLSSSSNLSRTDICRAR